MSRKKKIVIPTDDEVSAYGGDAGAEPAGPEGAEAEPSPSGDQTEASSGADAWKDKYLRAKAELANYQRRAQKDHDEALRYAHAGLVRALLPILDDLERVIDAGDSDQADAGAVIDGLRIVRDHFLKLLKEFHVVPIEAQGQPFDPAVHEAMMQQPSAEHDEPTVLQEVVQGFKLHDRVVRPARVIVSKPVGADEPGSSGDGAQSS